MLLSINVVDLVVDVLVVVDVTLSSDSQSTSLFDVFSCLYLDFHLSMVSRSCILIRRCDRVRFSALTMPFLVSIIVMVS